MTTIDTTPAASLTVEDTTPSDVITVSDGFAENGFQTTQIATGTGTTIFANQTDVTIDGGNEGVHIILDNPEPAAGMEEFSTQNLGVGSKIDGGNPGSGPDIAVNELDLVADAGIGVTRALQIQTNNLMAKTTDAGNIDIDNGVSASTTLAAELTAFGGSVNLTNAGTIEDFGSGISATGTINLTANGATADIDTGSGGEILSSGGAVFLTAGEDINLGDGIGNGTVLASQGVDLSAVVNVTVNANAEILNSSSGDISITAGGGITMLTSPGTISNAPLIENDATGGTITLTAGAGKTLTVAGIGGNAISSSDGNITLEADAMVINVGVDAGGAQVILTPASSGRSIDLGAGNSPSALGLTQAELNEITAAVVQVGNPAAAAISINAPISKFENSNVLALISADSILEEGLASLSIPDLSAEAGGAITLFNGNNDIGTFAGSASDSVSVSDGTNTLTIGEVDGDTGVASSFGPISFQADGLIIEDPVSAANSGVVIIEPYTQTVAVDLGGTSTNSAGVLGISNAELGKLTASLLEVIAGTGNITVAGVTSHNFALDLETGGAISQTAALEVTDLDLQAGSGITLTASGNSVGTLSFTNETGAVAFFDATTGVLTVGPSQNYGTTTTVTTDGALMLDGLYSGGAATITAAGDLELEEGSGVAAGGTVSLGSTGGSVVDNGASVDITAPTADLTASTGIGSAAAPLKTQIGTFGGATNTGGIFIDNGVSAPVTLNIGGNNVSVGAGVSGATGDISITNDGTIDSTTANFVIVGPGNVILKAVGSASDINVAGQGAEPSIDNGSGLIDLEAGRDVNLGGSTANSLGEIELADGSISVDAGRDFTINPNSALEIEAGLGGIPVAAGRNFTMNTTPAGPGGAPTIETKGGAIELSAGAGATMTLASPGSHAVASDGGNITMSADNLTLGAAVSSAGGNVTIEPVSAGQMISLGTATGGLTLTVAGLDEVAANTLTIGNATAGEVTVGGTVEVANVDNLTITTGSGFTESSGSVIDVGAGVLTIGFDESGVEATADLSNLAVTAGSVNVTGGTGNDTFKFTATGLTANHTVVGGGGTDHLVMTTAGTINAGGVSGIGIYDLASGGANTLTLTNANFAGVTGSKIIVNGGSGGNTINAAALTGSNQVSLVGGAGNDVFDFSAASLLASDKVVGGGGTDRLVMTTAGTINAGGVSGVGIYDLASGGANTLTLTNANFAGVTSSKIIVNGGSGGNTINAAALTGSNQVSLVGGAGNDVFDFSAASLLASDKVVGGGGTDRLVMTTAGTINAGGVSGVGIYDLASGGANTLTLTNANFAGVTGSKIIVNGGSGGNTVNASAVTGTNQLTLVGGAGQDTFIGGAGNDIFEFTAANLGASDTVLGGGGSNELLVSTAGTINAGGVSGVETYDLASSGANTLTLTSANFAEVTGSTITVDDGNGGTTLSASTLSAADSIIVHAGTGADTLVGGAGKDVFYAGGDTTMTGGGGADEFIFSGAGSNKITDFAHALDELVFRNADFNLGVDQGLGTSTPQQISASLFSTDTNGTFSSAASRFAYNTTTGALYYDASGSSTPGAAQLVATLTTHPAITAADLFFTT